MDRSLATPELPLLNRDEEYVSESGRTFEDDNAITYDALKKYIPKTHITTDEFNKIYRNAIRFFAIQERYSYKKYQSGELTEKEFVREATNYLRSNFPKEMISKKEGGEAKSDWDFRAVMNTLIYAVFRYDVCQPLIEDPDTTDIKICAPDDIRVRVKGKAYKSNAHFLDEKDLFRFIEGLAIRNKVNIFNYPTITFTDRHDPEYILRFTVSSPSVCAVDHPYLHIRKVPKEKPDYSKLIEDGMLNEKIRDYLIDRAKDSKGIVFAGPPGSGKTTLLNAFIEYIPKTRETLVIQENDELSTKQSGFMFKHVSHGFMGEPVCTLEDLGKIALVEGCNEFVIGEVKGGEMRYAMTLLNAGGHAAITVHSTNAYETLDKLADLVKYGSSYSFDEARRMLKTFDTVVYMEGYKVREILECTGYNDETKSYNYINIYRYGADEKK